MFKDTLKSIFPKVDKKDFALFAATQVASGSLAGGLTNTLVYPLIYVRTVLGADLGKVKKYNNMVDCILGFLPGVRPPTDHASHRGPCSTAPRTAQI